MSVLSASRDTDQCGLRGHRLVSQQRGSDDLLLISGGRRSATQTELLTELKLKLHPAWSRFITSEPDSDDQQRALQRLHLLAKTKIGRVSWGGASYMSAPRGQMEIRVSSLSVNEFIYDLV